MRSKLLVVIPSERRSLVLRTRFTDGLTWQWRRPARRILIRPDLSHFRPRSIAFHTHTATAALTRSLIRRARFFARGTLRIPSSASWRLNPLPLDRKGVV